MARDEMSGFDYDTLIEDAMRSVVKKVLEHVAIDGPTGQHCFYITFRTDHPGTEMPYYLMDDHPLEMTIVLQHRFWDLIVKDDSFNVTLSFNNIQEKLHIPYDALTVFEDRHENFTLQFEPRMELPTALPSADDRARSSQKAKGLLASNVKVEADKNEEVDAADEGSNQPAETNVVSLDAFRRK